MFRTLIVIVIIQLFSFTIGCAPGRGGIRRRGARKMTPLVYKQHLPNFSEQSLAASGLSEGIVNRKSDLFRKLVPNYNPDIIFKDEEGTGADRLMTQRCKEKLNTLAISVMNQWPGVRLRVTEGWDEDHMHSSKSLHYEGRAIDITTSDRDKRKYGMLARLAVESGFDWVYYESRSHIHASCKSEPEHPGKSGGCFKATSSVLTSNGEFKKMADLKIGDNILSVDANGQLIFSPIILFLDRDEKQKRQFYTVYTESGDSISLTPSHLIYKSQKEVHDFITNEIEEVSAEQFVNLVAVYAKEIQKGDFIVIKSSKGQFKISRVTKVEVNVEIGVYAPLTSAGNLVVDNVLASCYALIDSQKIAHAAFAPLRWFETIKAHFNYLLQLTAPKSYLSSKNNQMEDQLNGIHWYAEFLYSIAQYVMPNHLK